VTDPFIKNWMNLLCFLLSGLPANGTIAAEVCAGYAALQGQGRRRWLGTRCRGWPRQPRPADLRT
jgi:hypothetical protein